MLSKPLNARLAPLCAVALASLLSACSQSADALDGVTTSSVSSTRGYSMKDKECLARAMFFESHRSSREGLVAVGTVVMNRLDSGQYADTVCGVVGQKNQFAPGVLSRKMNSKALPDVMAAADSVLKGERHPQAQKAMFFHQAGLNFPYPNMHYVLQAGGNAFYEKRGRAERSANGIRPQSQLAAAGRKEGAGDRPQMVAVAKQPAPAAKAAEQIATVKTERETAPEQVVATSPVIETTVAPANTAMSYSVEPNTADAIGAMLLNQARPSPVE
ncbi:cell wall hydrolase [Mesorhizobium sp. CAU 1732]|uniref:cell wall hydrolase n=1 Tax=Mesorhizobium sp. CAU 1732 TaxID=3140358 RepID=UPI003260E53D